MKVPAREEGAQLGDGERRVVLVEVWTRRRVRRGAHAARWVTVLHVRWSLSHAV